MYTYYWIEVQSERVRNSKRLSHFNQLSIMIAYHAPRFQKSEMLYLKSEEAVSSI